MQPIVGRSPEQIRDDVLCKLHTDIKEALNQVAAGRCLYIGKQRQYLKELLEQVEANIMGERRDYAEVLGRQLLQGLSTRGWDRFGDPRR